MVGSSEKMPTKIEIASKIMLHLKLIALKQTGIDQNRKHKSVAETKKGLKTGPLNYHSHGYCINLKDKNEKDKLKERTEEKTQFLNLVIKHPFFFFFFSSLAN